MKISDLFTWEGTIDRGPYAIAGVIGFGLKHNLDRLVATYVFHRRWGLFNYWFPIDRALHLASLSHEDRLFLFTILATALPFIWVGVALTIKRLRSINVPVWLTTLFFAPFVNLLFFLFLSIQPAENREDPKWRPVARSNRPLGRFIPESDWGSAAAALVVTSVIGALGTLLSVNGLNVYGIGLFVAMPFCLGLVSALIYGYHKPRNLASCLVVSCLSVALLGLLLLAIAVEGVVCLLMAAPIGLILAMMGGALGYALQRNRWDGIRTQSTFGALLLFLPLMMGTDALKPQDPPLLTVSTQIEIAAPPQTVWRYITSFPTLAPPTEWPFRIGIAYPIRSTLVGSGVGAQRTCQFSSGYFNEPIDVWQENQQLGFRISGEPLVMEETSPYGHIHTKHIDGQYFQAQDARFVLTPLANGHTLLTGTSRYRNRMWPTEYWRLWSDAIVHQIHLRVFNHIKQLAEADAAKTAEQPVAAAQVTP
jgi:hypothetical protein